MYWAEWAKLRDVLRAKGKTAGEIEAHRYNVTLRAIGVAKSSKLLSNGELDRVIARIKAEVAPGDFSAQMRQQNQPDSRTAALLARCRAACEALANLSSRYRLSDRASQDRYIGGLSQKLHRKWPERCDERELGMIAGMIEKQVGRERAEAAEHAAKVEAGHSAWVAAGRPEAAPAKPAALVPGEDF